MFEFLNIDFIQPSSWVYIAICIFVAITETFLVWYVTIKIVKETDHYLSALGEASPVQIKGTLGKLYRYNLIKSFNIMKKFLGWGILILIVALVGVGAVLFNDSRDYFKTVFKNETEKINLRTEASVDSLQTIIKDQAAMSDSLEANLNNALEFSAMQKRTIDQQKQLLDQQSKVIKNLVGTVRVVD